MTDEPFEPPADEPKSDDPLAQMPGVVVSVPDLIEVRMVVASVLHDYEMWAYFASFLFTAAIAFLVAYLQGGKHKDGALLAITVVLAVAFLFAMVMALIKRKELTKKPRRIRYKAIGVVVEENPPADGTTT